MRLRGLLLLLGAIGGLAGCLSIPPPPDAGDDAGDDAAFTYAVDFGDLYPVGLSLDGTELLGIDAESCAGENGAGMSNRPAFAINGTDGLDTHSFTELTPVGAAVRKVFLTATRTTCGTDRVYDTDTTFTLFPDGLIVRYDNVYQNPSDLDLVAADCRCDSGDDTTLWFPASYVALAGVTRVQRANGNDVVVTATRAGTSADAPVCATAAGDNRVAFAWTQELNRVRRSTTRDTTVFTMDLVLPAETQNGISTSHVYRTLMRVAPPGDCAALATSLVALRDAEETLAIDGTPTSRALFDGIFGGDDGTSTGVEVTGAEPIVLTATTEILRGFAVRLTFSAGTPDHFDVTAPQTLRAGDYELVKNEDGSVIAWFRFGLDADETITLTPAND